MLKELLLHTKSTNRAAINLRQPFWDWAIYSTPPDEVIKLDKVPITRRVPKISQKSIVPLQILSD